MEGTICNVLSDEAAFRFTAVYQLISFRSVFESYEYYETHMPVREIGLRIMEA